MNYPPEGKDPDPLVAFPVGKRPWWNRWDPEKIMRIEIKKLEWKYSPATMEFCEAGVRVIEIPKEKALAYLL